jgi:hypothetical protein
VITKKKKKIFFNKKICLKKFFIMYSSDDYFDEVSNLYDIAAITLYLIGFITRFIPTEEFFTISK